MTKAEFLEKLRIELSSGVTPQVLQENLNYYGQYIDDEIRKGRTESEVLAELGDPWILAKTIVDAQREESVEDVIYDSRKAAPGKVFVAMKGIRVANSLPWLI